MSLRSNRNIGFVVGRPLRLVLVVLAMLVSSKLDAFAQSLEPKCLYAATIVRPADPAIRGMTLQVTDDRFTASNVRLSQLIKYAYGTALETAVLGLPNWADIMHFDVEAKMDSETVAYLRGLSRHNYTAERRHMFQALLEDRFQVHSHREMRPTAVYALQVAKSGFKGAVADAANRYIHGLQLPVGAKPTGLAVVQDGQLIGQAASLQDLVGALEGPMGRKIFDQTGLKGNYDFIVTFDVEHETPDQVMPGDPDSGAPLRVALRDQLGLELRTVTVPLETIVIDSVRMPNAN